MPTFVAAAVPPFHWPEALGFWAVYLLSFYASESRVAVRTIRTPNASAPSEQDPLVLVLAVLLVAQLAALALAWFGIGVPAAPWPTAMLAIGCLLMIGGAALRQHCFRMLGPAFTIEVRADPRQPVVDRGAYRRIRHPAYLAAIVMLIGFGLATGSIAGSFVVALVAAIVFHRRIAFEERALEAALGDRYRDYAAGRSRLLPGLY